MSWRFCEKQGSLEFMGMVIRNHLKQYSSMSKLCISCLANLILHNSSFFLFKSTDSHLVFMCMISYDSRIVWLGDLNYRISLSYRHAKALVEMQNWRALLEKDQVICPNGYIDLAMLLYFMQFIYHMLFRKHEDL